MIRWANFNPIITISCTVLVRSLCIVIVHNCMIEYLLFFFEHEPPYFCLPCCFIHANLLTVAFPWSNRRVYTFCITSGMHFLKHNHSITVLHDLPMGVYLQIFTILLYCLLSYIYNTLCLQLLILHWVSVMITAKIVLFDHFEIGEGHKLLKDLFLQRTALNNHAGAS